jgi:RNA polymerase sigma-70 factor (ECF subfamily)
MQLPIQERGRLIRLVTISPQSSLKQPDHAALQQGSPGIAVLQNGPDEYLLMRIAVGDRIAMRALYARHNVRVYRFVLRLVGDEMLAEDLVSEVFIDVFRLAAEFEARSAVSTWLLGIARFKACSLIRTRSYEHLDENQTAAIEDPADDPEVAALKKDRGEILRRCIADLSPEHREIIDLVYYHDRKIEEVAEIVGIPLNTVKTRMHYARKQMSALLQQAGINRAHE